LALRQLGDYEGALNAFEHASKVSEQFIIGFLDAGDLCLAHNDYERALRFFEQAKDAQPDDPRPWAALGWVYAIFGRHSDARDAYEFATSIDPENAETWTGLGNSLWYFGEVEGALCSFQRAIEVAPHYSWPYNNMAWILYRQKRFDEAIESINKAVELEPENGEFLVGRLKILDFTGKLDSADIDAELDRASKAAASDAELELDLAHIFVDNDRIELGRETLRGVRSAELRYDESRVSFAECLLKAGDTSLAVDLLRSINQSSLHQPIFVVWNILCLVADRVAGTAQLSEKLLTDLLSELAEQPKQTAGLSYGWNYKGLRRFLAGCEIPLVDKLVLATLTDLHEANVRTNDLSFFEVVWKRKEMLRTHPR
jgi:tetratricopeptide (TPR) repeat protein